MRPTFLDNLVAYLSVHPETPDIASVAQEVSELKSAIDRDDVPAIEAAGGTLKRQMEAVSGWSDFVRSRAEETRQAEIQALGEAVSLASKHQRFLRGQIAEIDIAEHPCPCDATQKVRERAAKSCSVDPD